MVPGGNFPLFSSLIIIVLLSGVLPVRAAAVAAAGPPLVAHFPRQMV